MKLTIDSQSTSNIWQLTDAAPVLEIYANEQFDTPDGQTVLPGNVELGDLCRRVVGAVVANVLTFPVITNFDSTEDSITNQRATYSAYIRANGREPIPWLLNFPVAPIKVAGATSVNWSSIRIHAARVIARRTNDVYTKQQTEDAITARLINFPGNSVLENGLAPMVAGQAAVSSAALPASSVIHLTSQDEGVSGTPRVGVKTPGAGFTILSSNGADEGNVGWTIIAA